MLLSMLISSEVSSFFAVSAADLMSVPVDGTHVCLAISHVVPLGQQCNLSEQQIALKCGQQPYAPLCISQHVVFTAHTDLRSGQVSVALITPPPFLVNTRPKSEEAGFFDLNLVNMFHGRTRSPSWLHLWWSRSHVMPWGQQWSWSEQHTAWS